MRKTLDNTFIQYGIRNNDMALVEMLARKHGLDFDWVQSLLKNLHAEKVKNEEPDDKTVERIIEAALERIRTANELGFYDTATTPKPRK
ncbi:MAG: hypothetical protein ACOVSW_12975 [Candidatus Kapaibacteriota bacterium]|jgi:hypothetical protein